MTDDAELITLTTSSPTTTHVATTTKPATTTKAASTRPKPMIAAACIVVASTFAPAPDSSRGKIIQETIKHVGSRAALTPLLILPAVGLFKVDTERGVTAEISADDSTADIKTGLQAIEHVDGAFLGPLTDSTLTVFVLAREHGLVDREALMDLEEKLSADRGLDVVLTVRAHQGRALRSLSGGADLLFGRG